MLTLPRQVRARASAVDADCIVLGLPPPAHSDGGGGDEDGCDAEGRRRSSRARIETQPPNTLALVEAEKARESPGVAGSRRESPRLTKSR